MIRRRMLGEAGNGPWFVRVERSLERPALPAGSGTSVWALEPTLEQATVCRRDPLDRLVAYGKHGAPEALVALTVLTVLLGVSAVRSAWSRLVGAVFR